MNIFFPGEDEENDSSTFDSDDDSDDLMDDTDSDEEQLQTPVTNKPVEDTQGSVVYSTGYGYYGQLGLGNCNDSLTFQKVLQLPARISLVAAGEHFSVALSAKGEVFSWGRNSYGQLGLGDSTHRFSPVKITALESFSIINISAGSFHTLFVSSKGDVYAAGNGSQGRLGRGDLKHCNVPRSLPDLKGKHISQTSCGASFSAAISAMGELYTWGSNKYGQLGQGKINVTSVPAKVTSLQGRKMTSIHCGRHHMTALSDKGDVFTFGLGACGQLGHKNRTSLNLPKRLDLLSSKPLRSYGAGYYHNVALTTNGQLYSWGYLSDDHIGLSEGDEYISNPAELDISVVESKKIVTVAAGGWHSCCITKDGSLYAWGFEYKGRLGNGIEDNDFNYPLNPTLIPNLEHLHVLSASCGGAHTLIIAKEKKPTTQTQTTTTTQSTQNNDAIMTDTPTKIKN